MLNRCQAASEESAIAASRANASRASGDGAASAPSTIRWSSPSAPESQRRLSMRLGGNANALAGLVVGVSPEGTLNTLIGSVVETIYLGDHLRVVVRLTGGTEIMVKMQAKPHLPMPRPGDSVPLSFRTEDCRALDPISPAQNAGEETETN